VIFLPLQHAHAIGLDIQSGLRIITSILKICSIFCASYIIFQYIELNITV
jgi:hypothetical protein